ncbi:MAG TPA: S41 family peptidase [Bdellovibrionota bacterium]|jgi:carboxyl-terminal processing protease
MTKLSLLLALLLTPYTFAKGAEPELSCAMVPTLTQFLLRYHVTIHSASDDLYGKATDQIIKRLDPSKVLLLQSDADEIRPKILKYFKSMKDGPDCKDMDALRDLLLQRAKDQLAFAKESLGPSYKLDENVELQLDPDKRAFPKNIEESHKRQLVQIHFQISNYMLAFKESPGDAKVKKQAVEKSSMPADLKKAKEQLIHRYELSVKRMEELKKTDIYSYAVNAFASAMDPHSNYMNPEETEDFRINMNLSLEGIGASLSNDDGYTVIQELIPGGAASRSAKLNPKDKIIAVSNKDGSMENVIDMDLKDVVHKIRGPSGTTVKLTILREKPEATRFNISLVRSKVQLEDEAAKVEFYDRKVGRKTMKLARIELPGFYGGQGKTARTSYRDMAAAVEKAVKGGAEGIVLDLSQNSGGLLEEAVRIAGLFISAGNIVATKDASGEVQMLDDIDTRVQFNGPMVVLISRLSASASEIVAGALQDYKRAIIVGGDRTYGKGSVQAVIPLQNDYGIMKVTTGLFFIPGGNSTQHRGVTSDIAWPNPFSTSDIGENHLDNSLPPDSIPTFVSQDANASNKWEPVNQVEIDHLKELSKDRVGKNKDFAEISKEVQEIEERKGLVKLSEMRKKEGESKKKNKDKAPKQLAKEKNKPQIDEALNILADFVNLRTERLATHGTPVAPN